MVTAQTQEHRHRYRSWQRKMPMALWQLDLVGGIYLADGQECKLLSGIDGHSRSGTVLMERNDEWIQGRLDIGIVSAFRISSVVRLAPSPAVRRFNAIGG